MTSSTAEATLGQLRAKSKNLPFVLYVMPAAYPSNPSDDGSHVSMSSVDDKEAATTGANGANGANAPATATALSTATVSANTSDNGNDGDDDLTDLAMAPSEHHSITRFDDLSDVSSLAQSPRKDPSVYDSDDPFAPVYGRGKRSKKKTAKLN